MQKTMISSICCCLLRAVHLCSDWAANCLENESPLPFPFPFSFDLIYISQKVKVLAFALCKRILMRSLNFDDYPFTWHTFGQSYVLVLGEGSFSAPNARQIVARQRFAGQKARSMRLIRNSPDEIRREIKHFGTRERKKRNWKKKKKEKKPAARTSLAGVSKAQRRSGRQKGGGIGHCMGLCSHHEKSPGLLRKLKQGNLCRFCQDIHISSVN